MSSTHWPIIGLQHMNEFYIYRNSVGVAHLTNLENKKKTKEKKSLLSSYIICTGATRTIFLIDDDWIVDIFEGDVLEGYVGHRAGRGRVAPWLDSNPIQGVRDGAVTNDESSHILLIWVLS